MIELKNVNKIFKDAEIENKALNQININLLDDEFCVLVGESGSGKSTLSRVIMGITKPTSGEVMIDGKNIGEYKSLKDVWRIVQLVFQDSKSSLDPRFTVYQSIKEPLVNLGNVSKDDLDEKIDSILRKLGLEESDTKNKKTHELSGGQQKRVCLARALCVSPRYLILDESLSGLDAVTCKQTLDLLKSIYRETKIGFLLITHDIDVALNVGNRIIVMKDGFVVEDKKYTGDNSIFTHQYTKMLLAQ